MSLDFSQVVLTPGSGTGALTRADFLMLEVVFQNHHDTFYYAKDTDSRWVSCNPACLMLLNLSLGDEVFGMTEADFFPPVIADAIRDDDLEVIRTGKPLLNRVELITNAVGELVWAQTNKFRLVSPEGTALGLIGTTSLLPDTASLPRSLEYFADTVDHIRKNLE